MITPSISEREQRVYSTLSTIHSLGAPTVYGSDRTLNLVKLTEAVAALV